VVKTTGAKGVHVFVPVEAGATLEELAAATRALAARAELIDPALATTAYLREDRGGKVFLDLTRAGGVTVVAVYSPRVRPGTPVSFPVAWDQLDRVAPADLTVRTAARLVAEADPWAGPAAVGLRADRGGPRYPGRPGAGDARGQAACSRAPRLTRRTVSIAASRRRRWVHQWQ
jgi:bifunctional non-homologous end joining protein LigD